MLSLVTVTGGDSVAVLRPLVVDTGSGPRTSVAAAHGLISCPVAYAVLLDQGLNPRPLNRRLDSQPPDRQATPQA